MIRNCFISRIKKGLSALLIAGIFLLPLAGCSLSDKTGKPVTSGETATYEKVVALSKSIGDMWLLSGGELIGITEDGLDLSGADGAVSVGTVTKPSLEAILALEPDLVLLSSELSSHLEIKEKLDSSGIKTVALTVNSFGDYSDAIKEMTELTGNAEKYEENVVEVSEKIDGICRNTDGKTGGTYLAIRVSATKNKALKNDYFACEIFNNLGLSNVVKDLSELDELNVEWIAAQSPDYIFIVMQGEESEALESLEDAFSSQPVWSELKAVKEEKVFVLPKDLFQYKPNAAWGDAYEYAYGLIYDR